MAGRLVSSRYNRHYNYDNNEVVIHRYFCKPKYIYHVLQKSHHSGPSYRSSYVEAKLRCTIPSHSHPQRGGKYPTYIQPRDVYSDHLDPNTQLSLVGGISPLGGRECDGIVQDGYLNLILPSCSKLISQYTSSFF